MNKEAAKKLDTVLGHLEEFKGDVEDVVTEIADDAYDEGYKAGYDEGFAAGSEEA